MEVQIPDLINALFELGTGLLGWTNVWRVFKDKKVRGYNIWFAVFVTLWGAWNLYYYPHLNQWLSFFGGVSIFLANMAWISLAFYYRSR